MSKAKLILLPRQASGGAEKLATQIVATSENIQIEYIKALTMRQKIKLLLGIRRFEKVYLFLEGTFFWGLIATYLNQKIIVTLHSEPLAIKNHFLNSRYGRVKLMTMHKLFNRCTSIISPTDTLLNYYKEELGYIQKNINHVRKFII